MSITRPQAMSPEDVDRIIKTLEDRGGNINIQDPRLSQLQTWLIGLVGLGIVGASMWMAHSISDLKIAFEKQSVMFENIERRVTNLEIDERDRRK